MSIIFYIQPYLLSKHLRELKMNSSSGLKPEASLVSWVTQYQTRAETGKLDRDDPVRDSLMNSLQSSLFEHLLQHSDSFLCFDKKNEYNR